ncbi:baeRF2 domain-containing protein [Pedococcus sp. 5OH_020]|uniref:baeRF2 domain-containing protein n=1 Tax=Pedococcus sp. 5OH_020 TaxID=2989814 RepID=UPI0022E9F68E|nr:Vms1/Ankzf1 family peptidyl-tRNA hydrolase [Pedococcus sp. 5OH_020]
MLPAELGALLDATPPFISVCLDVSRLNRAAGDDVQLHWGQLARRLEERDAPAETIEALGEAVTSPTGLGGEHARVAVAAGGKVVVDLVLPGRPPRDECLVGPVPHLMPVARALADAVPYALVRLDRTGADVQVFSAAGQIEDERVFEGDNDVLHKVPAGGWSQRRYQQRVEDSWARNAAQVADRLSRVVKRAGLELVLVAGDVHAVVELTGRADAELQQRLVVLDSGGRAAGVSPEAEQEAVDAALAEHISQRRRAVLDEYVEQLSRQQRAVEGLGPVVEVLRRGQVQRLVLLDDPTSTAKLWVGEAPQQVGLTEQDVLDAGAQAAQEVRADAALLWAVLGTDADISLVGDETGSMRDGIGALLRWSDPATPHDEVPSMPGHGEGPGTTGNVE